MFAWLYIMLGHGDWVLSQTEPGPSNLWHFSGMIQLKRVFAIIMWETLGNHIIGNIFIIEVLLEFGHQFNVNWPLGLYIVVLSSFMPSLAEQWMAMAGSDDVSGTLASGRRQAQSRKVTKICWHQIHEVCRVSSKQQTNTLTDAFFPSLLRTPVKRWMQQ